jgi:hypothetical protein
MLKNTQNSEKFTTFKKLQKNPESKAVLIAWAFHPPKRSEKCRKVQSMNRTLNFENAGKFNQQRRKIKKMQKSSENAENFSYFKKIQP